MHIVTREQREASKDEQLSPLAVQNAAQNSREYPEPESNTRTRFERDRDRIIHSDAWRALAGKMQVYRSGYIATVRMRMTHSLEVESIARTIAARLALNEDFAGCCAVKHDIAHPPYGHAGEHAVNESLGDIFEHNAHAYVTVTRLEHRSAEYMGLNLCKETNEASLKHSTINSTHLDPTIPTLNHCLPLEVQVADIADPIAYCTSDFQDAVTAGIVDTSLANAINQQKILQMANQRAGAHFDAANIYSALQTSSAIIKLLIADVCATSLQKSKEHALTSLDDVYKETRRTISFSDEVIAAVREFKAFMMENVYLGDLVKAQASKGKSIVRHLCTYLLTTPNQAVLDLEQRFAYERRYAVRDYVCSLTDNEAEQIALETGFISQG